MAIIPSTGLRWWHKLGGRLYYSLVVVIKEFGLEANQKAGWSQNINSANSSFERVEEF